MAQLHLQPGFWYSLSLCCFYCKKENFIKNTKRVDKTQPYQGRRSGTHLITSSSQKKKKIPLVGKTQLSQIMGFVKIKIKMRPFINQSILPLMPPRNRKRLGHMHMAPASWYLFNMTLTQKWKDFV